MKPFERARILDAALVGGAFDEAFDAFLRRIGKNLRDVCLGECCVSDKMDDDPTNANELRAAVEALVDGPTNANELARLLGNLQRWRRDGVAP